jgi:hypothetical protein
MKNPRIVLTAVLAVLCAMPSMSHASTLSTDVISMFPQAAGEFAYADLRQARAFTWFPQLEQQMLPARFKQFEQFLASAGIDPNSQVEEVAWALVPSGIPSGAAASTAVPTGEQILGVALGTFQPESAQAYFVAQKLPVVKVREYSLYAFGGGSGATDLFFCFIDRNTAAFGQRQELEKMIAVRHGEEPSLLNNNDLAPLINSANGSGVVWSAMGPAYTRLAMQQLVPETSQFPQAQQLVAKLRAMTIEIISGTGVEAHFDAVCATPDDANTFAALLQAGLMYQKYQVQGTNPDLAAMLDSTSVVPAGDHLGIRLKLTNDQVLALIRRNTFAVKM